MSSVRVGFHRFAAHPRALAAAAIVAATLMAPPAQAQFGEPMQGGARENPSGALSLADALRLTLTQGPRLSSAAWEVKAREARVAQAARFPNPTIGVLAEDLGVGDSLKPPVAGQRQTTVELSQLVELGGKRGARRAVAASDRDLGAHDYKAAQLDVLAETAGAFIDVVEGQESLALAREAFDVATRVHDAVVARVAAGAASPIEETRSGVALAAARIEAERARRALEGRRARLAAHWGASEARFKSATADLGIRPEPLAPSESASPLTGNPDLALRATEVVRREAIVGLEGSMRWPDVTLTAGYRRFADVNDRAFLIGAAIPLPLFDRNRDAITEAENRVRAARDDLQGATSTLSAALAEANGLLSSAHDQTAAIEAEVLPGALSAFSAIEEGYRLGKFGILDVLDAQRSVAAAKAQRLRALVELHKASIQVNRLLGRWPQEAGPAPTPTSNRSPLS